MDSDSSICDFCNKTGHVSNECANEAFRDSPNTSILSQCNATVLNITKRVSSGISGLFSKTEKDNNNSRTDFEAIHDSESEKSASNNSEQEHLDRGEEMNEADDEFEEENYKVASDTEREEYKIENYEELCENLENLAKTSDTEDNFVDAKCESCVEEHERELEVESDQKANQIDGEIENLLCKDPEIETADFRAHVFIVKKVRSETPESRCCIRLLGKRLKNKKKH